MAVTILLTPEQLTVINDILYERVYDGDTCMELAENYQEEVSFDKELFEAMDKLQTAASEMIARLSILNDQHKLEYDENDI